jgi:D-arabinose 1-dehydrogenase-like Zn-dependent alcohol dehydrogenase
MKDVGGDVITLAKGDNVNWGYHHSCCMQCKYCLTGHETLCPQRCMYGYHDLDQSSLGSTPSGAKPFFSAFPRP